MLIPNAPLVTILVATQVLNAVLLVPLLIVMVGIGRDRDLMGRFTIGLGATIAYWTTTVVVVGVRRCAGDNVGQPLKAVAGTRSGIAVKGGTQCY